MSWSKLSGHLHNAQGVLNARLHLKTAVLRGPGVRLWGRPEIRNEGTLIVGDRTRFISTVATLEMAVGPGGTLDIGERCFINYGTSIAATQLVRIGAHCNIGTHVLMMDNDFHRLEPERRNEMPESAPIILEENVWLGARVVVLRGVTIGEGSVVGAASVVARDVPPRTLVAGVPARVIKKL